jgi:HlyD family secretion protein
LNSRNKALSIEEKYIVYQNDSAYLYVLGSSGKEKVMKRITPGISDGTYTEIMDGAGLEDRIITNYDKEE